MAVVTFTTDFGTRDGYAGAMKGVVLQMAPRTVLVDISHDVLARDVRHGAFVLAQAAPFFPPGTVHVAVVDPGVGGARDALLIKARDMYFVGPDNGLLSLAAVSPRQAFRIESADFRRATVSPTFHGRDLFAPAAARLAAGWSMELVGPPVATIQELSMPRTRLGDGGEGEILHVDSFGNLFTSFEESIIPQGRWLLTTDENRRCEVRAGQTFADVGTGELVVYAGSSGRVEIAVRDGSAAQRLGIGRGARLRLERPLS